MSLQLACADFSFPLLPHGAALDVIASIGVRAVDVGVFGGRSHVRPEQALADIPKAARDLSEMVRGRGLEFADIFLIAGTDFRTLAANHLDPAERRRSRDMFRRVLELTAACNAPHMSGLPGVRFEEEPHESSLKRCAEELAWRVEQARQVGVIFSIEPHVGSVVQTPAEVRKLLEMTPGLTLTLDYGHFTYQGIPDEQVEPLVAHASHFHARCGRPTRLQSSLKENTIDFARILRAMKRAGYAGFLELEYVWIDWEHCNEVDNVSETILLRDLLLKEGATT